MHKLTFHPLGNADSTRIDLDGGMKILIDYADMRNAQDSADKRVDLPALLRADLDTRNYYDVVAFTHLDDDHIHGSSSFFYLEHALKYQDETPNKRIRMNEMWVPASVIVEEQCEDETRIIQAEARHRFTVLKDRIRVISKPDRLKEWVRTRGIAWESVAHLIVDAGKTVPGFTKAEQGVEFFIHSPFSGHVDAGTTVDRNNCSLVFQATFVSGFRETQLILSGDVEDEVLADIVRVTRYHGNEQRLAWDVIKIPHHCSYKALNKADKGKDETVPLDSVKWLYEQGKSRGIIVSTSWPVPTDDANAQPPHRQAANYYKRRASVIGGEFVVPMEEPTKQKPEVLVIEIDSLGARRKKQIVGGVAAVISRPAPRVG